MRNLGLLLLVILWGLFGWKMYSDHLSCCTSVDSSTLVVPESDDTTISCSSLSVCFAKNSFSPLYGADFQKSIDSLATLTGSAKAIKIIGLFNADETNGSTFENLGMARASVIKERLLSKIGESSLQLATQQVVGAELSDNDRIRFELIDLNPETSNTTDADAVAAIKTSTVIYFPFNSTEKLSNAEIEAYLTQVAERVKKSKEKISLVGHTDNIGPDESNLALGRSRAQSIKDYMVSKGVSASQITVDSKGESQAVASNDTEEGRARNRRTELTIFK